MILNDEQQELLQDMRAAGWAVTVVSPGELDGTNPSWVESVMREAAQREINWDFGEE